MKDTGRNRMEVVAYAVVKDVDAACAWVDDNCSKENRGILSCPFYDAEKDNIEKIRREADKFLGGKWERPGLTEYYSPSAVSSYFVRQNAQEVKDMLRVAVSEGQKLPVYMVSGGVMWCGYGSCMTILPTSLFNIREQKDYSLYSAAELLHISGGNPQAGSDALPSECSLSSIKAQRERLDEQNSALEKQIKNIEKGDTPELQAIKRKIEEMQTRLEGEIAAKKQEMERAMSAVIKKKRELERRIYVMDAQIYSVRCRMGEVINFKQIKEGAPCGAETPVTIYQSIRYLDEELGRHLSIFMDRTHADGLEGSFFHILRHREDIRDLFVPDDKCVAVVQVSRTGTVLSTKKDMYGESLFGVLEQYAVYHGKQVGILIRNGENLYIGWADDERIMLDNGQVFLTPGKSETAMDDAAEVSSTPAGVMLSRYYILQILQGVIEQGVMLKIPTTEHLFDGSNRYIRFNMANGAIEDYRYGTFEKMLERAEAIPLKKGDPIMSVAHISGTHLKGENSFGIGDKNRTYNCVIKRRHIYEVNHIEYDVEIEMTVAEYKAIMVREERTYTAYENGRNVGPRTFAVYNAVADGNEPVRTWKTKVFVDWEDVHDFMQWRNLGSSLDRLSTDNLAAMGDMHGSRIRDNCYYKKDSVSGDGWASLSLPVREENMVDGGTYYIRKYINANIVEKTPHYFVSLPMKWSEYSYRETDARANMEIESFWSPAYLCGTWLRYVVDTRHTGKIFVAGTKFDYSHCLPYLKTMLDYIDKREQEEKALLRDAGMGEWLDDNKAEEAWDVALLEWRIANKCRALTKASAARFAKYIKNR